VGGWALEGEGHGHGHLGDWLALVLRGLGFGLARRWGILVLRCNTCAALNHSLTSAIAISSLCGTTQLLDNF